MIAKKGKALGLLSQLPRANVFIKHTKDKANYAIGHIKLSDFFRQAIAEHGLNAPAEIIPDGQIHRFSSNGKRADLSSWYALYANEGRRPVGVFGDWRQRFTQTWTMDGTNTLTEAEKQDMRARLKALIEADKQAKQAAYAAAALTCTARWDAAAPANNHHPYLARKAVLSHGTRVEPSGLLLVPVCTDLENTRLQSLQTIALDGSIVIR